MVIKAEQQNSQKGSQVASYQILTGKIFKSQENKRTIEVLKPFKTALNIFHLVLTKETIKDQFYAVLGFIPKTGRLPVDKSKSYDHTYLVRITKIIDLLQKFWISL